MADRNFSLLNYFIESGMHLKEVDGWKQSIPWVKALSVERTSL
jgi:hypothetical protein